MFRRIAVRTGESRLRCQAEYDRVEAEDVPADELGDSSQVGGPGREIDDAHHVVALLTADRSDAEHFRQFTAQLGDQGTEFRGIPAIPQAFLIRQGRQVSST